MKKRNPKKSQPKRASVVEHTVSAWSKAIGIDAKALAVRLAKEGLPNEGLIPARDIIAAMAGEKDASIIRLNNAKAEEIEMERKVRDKELVELPTAERELWSQLLGPLKQEMDLMPAKLAPLVSEDPQRVLLAWVEDLKKKFLKGKQ